LAVGLWVACSAEDKDPATAPSPTEASSGEGVLACGEGGCPNAIDQIVVPLLAQKGLEVRPESPGRLCRRLAVDLWGRAPTWGEVESMCLGRSGAEMVDGFLASEDAVLEAQRQWADRLEYNDDIVWWRYIEQADKLVASLVREELGYRAFATAILAHPAFVGRNDGEARVAHAFHLFLGRDALPSEREDLSALWAAWDYDKVTDPEWGHDYHRWGIDTRECNGTLSKARCTALLYGGAEVAVPLRNPQDPDSDENFVPQEELTAAELAILEEPGKLLSRLPVFSEAAVDTVLNRLLGYEAGRALPRVRLALMKILDETDSIRAVEREVLTSVLYMQSAERPEKIATTDDLPDSDTEAQKLPDRLDWLFGPTKQMRVEPWMNSIQRFCSYGHTEAFQDAGSGMLSEGMFGSCDHRFPEMIPGEKNGETHYHPSTYPLEDAAILRPDFSYRDFARNLGGCPDHVQFPRFTGTGVILSLEQRRFVQTACYHEAAFGMFPPGQSPSDISDAALVNTVRHVVRGALSRDPSASELADLVDLAQECLASTDTCAALDIPRHICAAVISSAEFLYY
jgi:hypothetical protein